MNSTPSEPAAAAADTYLGDLTPVARKATVTEANLLKNALIAAGIPASVADANFIQADTWLTTAAGGVRVLVPASFVEQALSEIPEIEKGAYALEGEDAVEAVARPQATDLALWPPDAAAFWSFLLTPLFGAVLHYANSRVLGQAQLARTALAGLVMSSLVTFIALYMALQNDWGLMTGLRASLVASAYTALWYIFAAYPQSRYVATSFGRHYARKGLAGVVVAAAGLLTLAGAIGLVLE
jgi:hypothetical protein